MNVSFYDNTVYGMTQNSIITDVRMM